MNPNRDDTPDTDVDTAGFEAMTPTTDPTDTPPFEVTYARAHHAARAVLERIGIPGTSHIMPQIHERDADRLVSTVLGAALLELERPWRDELEAARAAAELQGKHARQFHEYWVHALQLRDGSQVHADYLTARLNTATDDANRRGELIDEVERLLADPGGGSAPARIVDALIKLRDELDR